MKLPGMLTAADAMRLYILPIYAHTLVDDFFYSSVATHQGGKLTLVMSREPIHGWPEFYDRPYQAPPYQRHRQIQQPSDEVYITAHKEPERL